MCFHKLVVDVGFCVPTTFVELHLDHATHDRNRIDHIVVPIASKPSVIKAATLRSVDTLLCREDHWPTLVEIVTSHSFGRFRSPTRLSSQLIHHRESKDQKSMSETDFYERRSFFMSEDH